MDRREMVRWLGGIAIPSLAGLSPGELLARTREAHAAARAGLFRYLDPHQGTTVAQIAELIMPATDTPGAAAAGVPGFIDVIVGEWYSDEDRAAFLRGLADLDARAQALFGQAFVEASEPQQTAVLTGMDAEARAMPPDSPRHFFARIKNLTLYGYYTSEIGYTQELGDALIPGTYDGCAPLRLSPPGGP